ncbi:uncharacterized protein N7459_000333 [Penicillium hispanicum]|uniref:uncharacterized protein n=1 Tax=Penicillium hispanicum TaxID=1080232 RepID=UPI00253FF3CC|nr:uncharacterized protein N7459_000333 [Penicillium hispanicum]KAJ5594125.1 hypothetical protein N7459_000333 [Penicillium hispanicum]
MAPSIFAIAGTLAAIHFVYKLFCFGRNYLHARRADFPVFVVPAFTRSALWMVLAPALQPQLEKYLPTWLLLRFDVAIHGWEFRRKRWYHERLGNIFILVTPDECSLWCADAAVATVILQQRNEFQQLPVAGRILGFLGPNVFMANGDDWKRHRRMFAANLDERISRTVWIESCQQAHTMAEYMVDHPGNETLDGLHSIAINVIGKSGFNQTQEWSPTVRDSTSEATSGRSAYFALLSLVTGMILEAAFMPRKLMKLPLMPLRLQKLGMHLEKAPKYLQEVLDEERQAADNMGPRNNFLSLMLKFADEEKHSGPTGFSLTNEEISGSLFVFTTAGFETTANTMGYAVTLLAMYPEWQEWMREELQGLDPDPLSWPYEDVYPKCRRTLAVMYETLRLYTPVLQTSRAVLKPTQIDDGNGTHYLSAPMDVYIEQAILHIDPTVWGQDVMEFKPSRWFDEAGQFITPPKGTFFPWSGGPRICPGMKMAQVEFVASFATLFRSARCEPLPTTGLKTPEDLKQGLKDILDKSISRLTLTVQDAKEVQLRWIKS